MKFNTIGTIGVIPDAKERGIIKKAKPLLEALVKNKVRISRELYRHALKLADEE